AAKKSRRASMFKEEVSTVELGDDEVIELEDMRSPRPAEPERTTPRPSRGPGTAVRNAVKLPSGPLDLSETGGGDPDSFAGGAGGRASRGIAPLTGPAMPAQAPPQL